MPFSEITLDNREIVPVSDILFGVIVTDTEAAKLQCAGYVIKTTPIEDRGVTKHYIDVWLGAHQRKAGFELPGSEWKGRADVVIAPIPWRAGKRKGVKFYVVSVKESKCIT